MSLYRFFQPANNLPKPANLPNPSGPLSSIIPPQANAEVSSTLDKEAAGKKRGPYLKLSKKMKAKIGKYASENGDVAAVKHFSDFSVKQSTVNDYKKAYYKELNRKRKAGEDLEVKCLPVKKYGGGQDG